jgi:hypothetical protein
MSHGTTPVMLRYLRDPDIPMSSVSHRRLTTV